MRKTYNMNFDWQFHDGDLAYTGYESVHDTRFKDPKFLKAGNCGVAKYGYDGSQWDVVNVPHDFRTYRNEYDPENVPEPEGFLTAGIVWYRKSFFVEKGLEGKKVHLEFDGVYRDSEIYLNGHFVGRHLSGYTSFDYEVSDVVLYDQPNVVAVRVDASKFEGWWYEAAGIYRDVRLVVTEPLHVVKDGVFIRAEKATWVQQGMKEDVAVPEGPMTGARTLLADVEVANDSGYEGFCYVTLNVFHPQGKTAYSGKQSVPMEPYTNSEVSFAGRLNQTALWDLDKPQLYTYEVALSHSYEVTDIVSGSFGIKDMVFTADNGIFINGRSIKIQGVCVHDDFAVVGGGMPESVIRHKIQILKDMGCNAYRCSHNPPSPYLLKACDEIGLLVMDETRLMSTADEYIQQMEDLFRRDRNHACLFVWSIGNEEMNIHGTPTGVKIMKRLQRLAHKLDDTRPVTYANNANWNEITRIHEANGFHNDILGFNYYVMRQFDLYEDIHRDFPDRCILGTENGSGQTTRGQYLPREEELNPAYYSEREQTTSIWCDPDKRFQVTAQCNTYPLWGSTPLETMKAADKPYVAGYFTWTGFDYRGEIFPFTWPSVITRYGIIDLFGIPKDTGHQHRGGWFIDKPAIHLMPHWNFDSIGQDLDISITANTEEVELMVNGQSKGKQSLGRFEEALYKVAFEPGEIIAIGYNEGREVIRESHITAGQPSKVALEVTTKAEPVANGEDIVFVKVCVTDHAGNVNLNTSNHIVFELEGHGTIAGTGNGDPLCHDHDANAERDLFNGLALVGVKTTRDTGMIKLTAKSEGLESCTIEIPVTIAATDELVAEVKDQMVHKFDTKDAADGGV